jgi:hypothetical protein
MRSFTLCFIQHSLETVTYILCVCVCMYERERERERERENTTHLVRGRLSDPMKMTLDFLRLRIIVRIQLNHFTRWVAFHPYDVDSVSVLQSRPFWLSVFCPQCKSIKILCIPIPHHSRQLAALLLSSSLTRESNKKQGSQIKTRES